MADYRVAMTRRWRTDTNGYPVTHFYDECRGKSVPLYLHRLVTRAAADVQVDHRKHDLLDCRRRSLRIATPSQNSANTRRPSLVGKKLSRFRGVTRHVGGKWQAACKYLGVNFYLGLFDDEEEAAGAYNAKASELWGPFAQINYVPRRRAA